MAYVNFPGSYLGIIQMKIRSLLCMQHSCVPQSMRSHIGVTQITVLKCLAFDMYSGYIITSFRGNRE